MQSTPTTLSKSSPEILYAKGKRALRAKMERMSCCRQVGSAIAESSQMVFSDVYDLTRQIDSGSYSNVYEAVHRQSQVKYAVKIIDRTKLKDTAGVYHEVNILRYLDRLEYKQEIRKNVVNFKKHLQHQKQQQQQQQQMQQQSQSQDNKQRQQHEEQRDQQPTSHRPRHHRTTPTSKNRRHRRHNHHNRHHHSQNHTVRLIDFFEDTNYFYLVMEYLRGGNVFTRVIDRQYYTESQTKRFALSLLESVRYVHANGVAHRDLKPDNLLLVRRGSDTDVRIGDFGFAARVRDKTTGRKLWLTERCGTPAYVAPEILRGVAYDESADMWSVGAILYFVMGGYPPFVADSPRMLFRRILGGVYEFHEGDWGHASDGAKDFIRGLLEVDPRRRLTAEQALRSEWIRGGEEVPRVVPKVVSIDDDLFREQQQQHNNKEKTFKPSLKGMKRAQSPFRKLRERFHETKISPDNSSDENSDRIKDDNDVRRLLQEKEKKPASENSLDPTGSSTTATTISTTSSSITTTTTTTVVRLIEI